MSRCERYLLGAVEAFLTQAASWVVRICMGNEMGEGFPDRECGKCAERDILRTKVCLANNRSLLLVSRKVVSSGISHVPVG